MLIAFDIFVMQKNADFFVLPVFFRKEMKLCTLKNIMDKPVHLIRSNRTRLIYDSFKQNSSSF